MMPQLASLIPPSVFESQATLVLWLFSAVAIAVLVYGADRAVSAAVRLAAALGMSTVLIGATVVSLGTTAPETFVSVTAAFAGDSGLALGNGVGSIICDTALIFGLGAMITRLPKNRFILSRHGWLQLGSGVLLASTVALLAWQHGGITGVLMPRWVGGLFLVLLVGYLWISVVWARKHPDQVPAEVSEELAVDPNLPGPKMKKRKHSALANLLILAIGLLMVILGSNVLVGSVDVICKRIGVPDSVLAVTLVAFGTSLPELVTALMSIRKGHPELLVGNIIGADILNVLFVIGASASAVPLEVPTEFFYLHLPVMLLALLLLRAYIFLPSEKFSRWHGVLLLLVFLGYYTTLLVLVVNGTLTVDSLGG